MWHGVKKFKFRKGKDANKMLIRKLAGNFLKNNKLETTEAKAKAIKPLIERMIQKTKTISQANKNYLLKYLADVNLVEKLFKEVGPTQKDRKSGYLKITRLNQRASDGAMLVRLNWVTPVIAEVKKEVAVKKEPAKEKAEK